MLRSFLHIALRNFAKRRGYSILNLLGFTIGISCCLLIFEYVGYERSFDSYNPDAKNIFRVQENDYENNHFAARWATTSPAVGPALKKDFPAIQSFCRLYRADGQLTNPSNNVRFHEEKSYAADAAAIGILDLHLVKGDPATALIGPAKVILNKTTA